MKVLLPIVYLGNISYYSTLLKSSAIVFEQHEHFVKQTYRNRTSIYGANGKLDLIIPTQKNNGVRRTMKEVKIAYDDNWQNIHWKSIQSAYRSSPYFEYYEDDFTSFYCEKKHQYLIDFNQAIQEKVLDLLSKKIKTELTTTYQNSIQNTKDLRDSFSPKTPPPLSFSPIKYKQVFENKLGFIENLSIFDLLFNTGPESETFILKITV